VSYPSKAIPFIPLGLVSSIRAIGETAGGSDAACPTAGGSWERSAEGALAVCRAISTGVFLFRNRERGISFVLVVL
jgi:hypothetical protein